MAFQPPNPAELARTSQERVKLPKDGRLALHVRGGHAAGCPLPLGRRSRSCCPLWHSAPGSLTVSPLDALQSQAQGGQTPAPGQALGGEAGGPLGDTGQRYMPAEPRWLLRMSGATGPRRRPLPGTRSLSVSWLLAEAPPPGLPGRRLRAAPARSFCRGSMDVVTLPSSGQPTK